MRVYIFAIRFYCIFTRNMILTQCRFLLTLMLKYQNHDKTLDARMAFSPVFSNSLLCMTYNIYYSEYYSLKVIPFNLRHLVVGQFIYTVI